MKYFDRNTWFWIFMAGIFFIPFLGGVHLFDWDEINFAELAREMVVSGDYLRLQINYESFTEKPPMFFWLQAMSMHLFGVGEFAARFPNALLGMVVLPFLYISGKFLVDRKFGFLWAMCWFGSILPFLYFKSGIIDPFFNFFTFAGIFFLIHYIWKKTSYRDLYFSKTAGTYLWMAGIFIGLAISTKGPVAYLVVVLTLALVWVAGRFRHSMPLISFIKFSFLALAVFLLWFSVEFISHGPDFLIDFTIRQWELLTSQDAGHGGFFGYHFVVLLLGCFPASIFALRSLGGFSSLPFHIRDFQRWMIILLLVILVLFSLVGTKIIHYSSLAYYPITFLAALAIWNFLESRIRYRVWLTVVLALLGIIVAVASLALPYAGQNPGVITSLLENDPFALANLRADVSWGNWTYLPGVLMLFVTLGFVVLVRSRMLAAMRLLFFGTGIWVLLALTFFVGRVEHISQRAAVNFFKDQQGKEVYVTTFGYKSYVPWFYARVQPYENEKAQNQNWLLHGQTDRPVLISAKVTRQQELEKEVPDARFLYEKNGFVFYQR
ncbi:MAG: glycosyltransferase family 39 protein [Owenweeksia sp.]|nr:glycosyltransferase family 39 protein [Owenweeksia sp.]